MAILFFFFLVRFSKDSFDNTRYRLDALVPPRLRIDIERDAARAARVSHVVTGNLETRAEAPHQAGVHGPEAAEVDRLSAVPAFRAVCLQVTVKQVVPIERLADLRWQRPGRRACGTSCSSPTFAAPPQE